MIKLYREWAKKLTDAGIDVKKELPENIVKQARERKVGLDYWQIMDAIWVARNIEYKLQD